MLACKILFDNPTAPNSRPPVRSWKTLYHFAESLRSSRRLELDASDSSALHEAAAFLQLIVGGVGDDYNLARFRLGQIYLLIGTPGLAAQQFENFTQRTEEDIAWHTKRIREKWGQITAARKSRLFKAWTSLSSSGSAVDKAWNEITLCLEGGLLQQITQMYLELPEKLNQYFKTPTMSEKSVDIQLNLIAKTGDARLLDRYVEALIDEDERIVRAIKEKLDIIFDPAALDRIYSGLNSLRDKVDFSRLIRGEAEGDPAQHLAEIKQCQQMTEMKFLKAKLEELKNLWSSNNWFEVSNLLDELRECTTPVSEYEASHLISQLQTKQIYRIFFPAVAREFDPLEGARKVVQSPLYLESLYYSAYARLQTFELPGLMDAFERAVALTNHLKTENPALGRDRRTQLYALTKCLRITAAARLHIEKTDRFAGGVHLGDEDSSDPLVSLELTFNQYLIMLDEPEIVALTRHTSTEICADAYVAYGLLLITDDDGKRPSVEKAALQFESALRLRPRADSYVYLAECRIKQYRREEAIDLLHKALDLANYHPLAKRRLTEWTIN